MTPIVQEVVVFAIVAAAIGYAAFRFMPKGWRTRLAARAAAWVVRSGGSEVAARRVEAKLASGGACGSCDSCRSCATPAVSSEPAETASAYRVVPIGRARS